MTIVRLLFLVGFDSLTAIILYNADLYYLITITANRYINMHIIVGIRLFFRDKSEQPIDLFHHLQLYPAVVPVTNTNQYSTGASKKVTLKKAVKVSII